MDIDTRELSQAASDLGRVSASVARRVPGVVSKAALNIKVDLQREAEGIGHAPHFPASITYDMRIGFGRVEAEIGPDKERRQGALGNILYFGTSKNGPVLPDPKGALDREAPKLESHLANLLDDAL